MRFFRLFFAITVFLIFGNDASDRDRPALLTQALLKHVGRKNHDVDVTKVADLIAQGADVNAISIEAGNPVLHLAIQKRSLGAVKALLAAGAEVELPNKYGTKSLNIAASRDVVEAVPWLMVADERLDRETTRCGSLPLHDAAGGGGIETIRLILSLSSATGVDINAKTRDSHSPLQIALVNTQSVTIEQLLLDPRLELGHELDESNIRKLSFDHSRIGDGSMKKQLRFARSILGRKKP